MELLDAHALARGLMDEHGLGDWTLVFDAARTRAGVTRPGRREIGLSRVLTLLHTDAEVRDTVLHEIAHALVGAEHGHGPMWRAKARELGCSAERCLPLDAARAPTAWVGTCPAGHTTGAHRRPQRVRSCSRCSPGFALAHVFTWTKDGASAPMHPAYEAELEALRRLERGLAPVVPLRRPELPALPVGQRVTIRAAGRFAGLRGTIAKRARTRYHVRTDQGLLAVPFGAVEPA